jgi:molecular chaperone HtpG
MQQGRDALLLRLKENEELFRYELSDFGEAESLLAEYLAGKVELEQVIRASTGFGGGGGGQRQEVRQEQVGTVENELPSILSGPTDESESADSYTAMPPIMRREVASVMKVLTVAADHPKLNDFRMFLAFSDRLARSEGEFFYQPHTTKVMWGSHRVIYIFTDATGELNLYYDIKLKDPLESQTTGGSMFPTTTIVTKDRIFIPVPKVLEPAFQITNGCEGIFCPV